MLLSCFFRMELSWCSFLIHIQSHCFNLLCTKKQIRLTQLHGHAMEHQSHLSQHSRTFTSECQDHTNLSMLTALYTPRQLWIGWSRPSPSLRRIHLPHRFLTIATVRMLTPTNDKTENTVTSTHCNEPWPTTPWNPLIHYVLFWCTGFLCIGCKPYLPNVNLMF